MKNNNVAPRDPLSEIDDMRLQLCAIKACLQLMLTMSPQQAAAVRYVAARTEDLALALPLTDAQAASVADLMRWLSTPAAKPI